MLLPGPSSKEEIWLAHLKDVTNRRCIQSSFLMLSEGNSPFLNFFSELFFQINMWNKSRRFRPTHEIKSKFPKENLINSDWLTAGVTGGREADAAAPFQAGVVSCVSRCGGWCEDTEGGRASDKRVAIMTLGAAFICSFYLFSVRRFFFFLLGIKRLFMCNFLICHLPTLIFMGQTTHTGPNETKQQIIVPIVSDAGNDSVWILR